MSQISRALLYRSLGFEQDRIPLDFEGCFQNVPICDARGTVLFVADVQVFRSESARHRIFVFCPKCKYLIPFGRFMQHEGKRACAEAEKRNASALDFDGRMCYAGRCVDGYVVLTWDRYGFEGYWFSPTCRFQKRFAGSYVHDAHYSMIASCMGAWADWLDDAPDPRISMHAERVRSAVMHGRLVTEDEFHSITFELHMARELETVELSEAMRRARLRDRLETRRAFSINVRSRFPWLFQ